MSELHDQDAAVEWWRAVRLGCKCLWHGARYIERFEPCCPLEEAGVHDH